MTSGRRKGQSRVQKKREKGCVDSSCEGAVGSSISEAARRGAGMRHEILRMGVSELMGMLSANNPRQIGPAAMAGLEASIERFGVVQPMVWNRRTETVVAGEQRIRVLSAKGIEDVDVVVVDMDAEGERALNVALNNPAIAGEFTDALETILDEIEGADGLLYDELFLNTLRSSEHEETRHDDTPEARVEKADELQAVWRTARGQVWEILSKTCDGRSHRLSCGSVAEDAAAFLEGRRYRALITDPPYGVSYADKNEMLNALGKGNLVQASIENDDKSPAEMREFWTKAFSSVRTYAEPGACYYVTGPQGGELLFYLMGSLQESGFPLRHCNVWVKNQFVLGRSDYNYKHEPILYGWCAGAAHTFLGGHSETSVWEVDKPRKSEFHPTMKPVELFGRAIRNCLKGGEVVFDPFLGSGTTMVAAEQLGRICYGMEIEAKYVAVTLQRMAELGLEPRLVDEAR